VGTDLKTDAAEITEGTEDGGHLVSGGGKEYSLAAADEVVSRWSKSE
jgi:hypothetical protein